MESPGCSMGVNSRTAFVGLPSKRRIMKADFLQKRSTAKAQLGFAISCRGGFLLWNDLLWMFGPGFSTKMLGNDQLVDLKISIFLKLAG